MQKNFGLEVRQVLIGRECVIMKHRLRAHRGNCECGDRESDAYPQLAIGILNPFDFGPLLAAE